MRPTLLRPKVPLGCWHQPRVRTAGERRLGALLAVLLLTLLMATCGTAEASPEPRPCHAATLQLLPFDPAAAELPMVELGRRYGQPGAALLGAVVTRRHVEWDAATCTLTAGWAEPVLWLASEVAAQACARDHVLAHEAEHVRIYRAALGALPERIQALRAQGLGWQAAAEAALIEVRAQHQAHDSDEELDRNRTACGGRIARIARRALGSAS